MKINKRPIADYCSACLKQLPGGEIIKSEWNEGNLYSYFCNQYCSYYFNNLWL